MSFSMEVKEELSRQMSGARHCQIAEFAAIVRLCGRITGRQGRYMLCIVTENIAVARKASALLVSAFAIQGESLVRMNPAGSQGRIYGIEAGGYEQTARILQALKLLDENGLYEERRDFVSGRILMNACCRRAFLRGAFLSGGSISNPQKSYHFEIVCQCLEQAEQLKELIASFGIEAKTVFRKKHDVLYIKDGNRIVDILNIMEAHVSLMKLENVRILKEISGSINRQVNCEASNIKKTVSAAVGQIEDIKYIRERIGFDELPDGLREIAVLRLEKSDAPLKDLGEALNPPVGKSGVNHRLRKLREIASRLREEEEKTYGIKENHH